MAHIILKPSKDEDFYVYYSTVMDMPLAWGDRESLTSMPDFGSELLNPERWERADTTGTSERSYAASFGDDNNYNYGKYGYIPRRDLKVLCMKFEELGEMTVADDHPDILALLTPFEED